MPGFRSDFRKNNAVTIEVRRPKRTVRYTKSQVRDLGALDSRTIFHQLTHNFGFDPVKKITVRDDVDSRYYEQELDAPIGKPMFE